jgi:hypothetical protein
MVCDQEGTVIDEPSEWLKTAGFIPETLYEDSAMALSSAVLSEPPYEIVIDGQKTRLSREVAVRFKETHRQRLRQDSDLQAKQEIADPVGGEGEKELLALREGYARLRGQEDIQNDLAVLHLMDSRECPLYQVTCACQDKNVPKVKEEIKGRLAGKQVIPDYVAKLRKLEAEIARREIYQGVLKENATVGNDKNHGARVENLKEHLAKDSHTQEVVERWDKWRETRDRFQPILALKDKAMACAKAIGLDLVKTGAGFLLNGGPVEYACRVERAAMSYCFQAASGAPVILVDDFDASDIAWKTRLLGHAKASGNTVIFFGLSSKPKYISGVSSWHLSGGKLEAITGPLADRQAA